MGARHVCRLEPTTAVLLRELAIAPRGSPSPGLPEIVTIRPTHPIAAKCPAPPLILTLLLKNHEKHGNHNLIALSSPPLYTSPLHYFPAGSTQTTSSTL